MARIAGVDLPPKKRAEIGLTYIYGIGRTRAKSLLHRTGVDPNKKIGDMTEDEVNNIRQILEDEGAVEGDLRKEVSLNIKRHIEMGSYRGLRHRRGLPVRGQRSHTISRPVPVCGSGVACRYAGSAATPTRAPVRDRARAPWQARRKRRRLNMAKA